MEPTEELKDKVEEARAPFDRKVAVSMAVIAAALAIVSVLGHIETTEELLNQQRASDQWAYYQAKNLRRYESEVARDVFTAMKTQDSAAKYQANMDRYEKDTAEIEHKAKEFEQEGEHASREALRLHGGETLLEIGIVLASLAILTKRRLVWLTSMGVALLGIVVACSALLV